MLRSLLALALLAPASLAQATQLDWLPGRTPDEQPSGAWGVSDDGSVILGSSAGIPVVWRDGRVIELVAPTGYGSVDAIGLSPDGSTIVGYGAPLDWQPGETVQHPMVWDNEGVPTLLGTPSGTSFPLASDASNGGNVIVGLYPSGEGSGAVPSRWTESTGWLPVTPNGGDYVGVSADGGTVIGQSAAGAFRWTESSGYEPLGDLPGGEEFSFAVSISSNGVHVTGHSISERGSEVFLWTEGEGMMAILEATPGDVLPQLIPTAVSDTSAIVGMDWYSDGTNLRAFLWDPLSGLQYLDEIAPKLVSEGTQTMAMAISADGKTIVGQGSEGAWVLRLVPEPTTLTLLAIGSLAALRRS